MKIFRKTPILQRLLIIVCLAICGSCSSKQSKDVQVIPAKLSVDSVVAILNEKVASQLNFEIRKNKCYLDVDDVIIVEPLYEKSSSAGSTDVVYILDGVSPEKYQFHFDSTRTRIVLEMTFPLKRFSITIFNNGDFTKQEDRVKHIGWMQPEKISISFKSVRIDTVPTLRFSEIQLSRQPKLEKVQNAYLKKCFATIENDITESMTVIFRSEKMMQLFNKTLEPVSKSLKNSPLFQTQENTSNNERK